MFNTAGSVTPKTRKGRTATVQPSTNLLNNGANRNSIDTLRVQRLRLLGVIGARAELLARLAWGEAA
jgi:hypothetical protein